MALTATGHRGAINARTVNPSRVLVFGFAGAILVGALLLSLPPAAASGVKISWSDALFTAASAVCVTGLTVVDTASSWSWFGQAVILILVHLGGLGLMTMSTLVALILGKRITFRHRLIMQTALHQVNITGVVKLTRGIILTTFLLEAVVIILLTGRWVVDYPFGQALWLATFHAGMAFNNAGFDLFGNSLHDFVTDPWVLLPLAFLIICGGLGFSVLVELSRWRETGWRGFTLHTKAVVAGTVILTTTGFLALLAFEAHNSQTFGPLTAGGKLLAAFFTAVSGRTAGFSVVSTSALTVPSLLLIVLLMFIGGSPGSTAGGIKTTTFIAIIAAVRSTLGGHADVVLFKRRLDRGDTDRALAIGVIGVTIVALITMCLLLTEQRPLLTTMFEVTSAAGTTGLSLGLTGQLSTLGRMVIIATMFTGRVGPLTLAFALARRHRAAVAVRYPEDRLMIG